MFIKFINSQWLMVVVALAVAACYALGVPVLGSTPMLLFGLAIAGMRGTGDWGTDERPKNFRETILWRQPNGMTPITAMMARMDEESVDDPEFSWWEEELNTIRVQETTGLAANAGSTTITASGGGLQDLVAGDLLLVEKADQVSYDNEIIEVTAVASDTSATVARAAAGTTIAAIAANSFLTKIGNVYEEGSDKPTASTRNPTKFFNYCQIFKTVYSITETAKRTRARTGDPLKNDKKRKMFDHSIALEWSMILGRRSEVTGSGGKPKRTLGGIRSFLSSNVTVFSTTPTEDTFLDAVYPCFDYATQAGDERIILAGNQALNALNQVARDSSSSRIHFNQVVRLYGMRLQEWVLPQGTVYIKTHPLLNTHPRYKASMFIIDGTSLKYRYLRDTGFKDNVQGNGEDQEMGQWLTECSLEIHHEKTMGYLGNFTKP